MEKHSAFDGGLLGLICINLVCYFLNLITLTIAVPWTVCMKEKWIAEHTYVDGHRLTFDGTGAQLIGNWIKWMLLSIITFGIYSLWLGIKLKQWTAKHTHFYN